MIRTRRIASLAALATLFATPAMAFETEASHAVILDFDSGIVLYGKNAETPMTPASMTKMMTVFLVFERLKDGRLSLDDEFTVSVNAWRKGGAASGGSTMFLDPNSKVRVEDLLKGVMVLSGNDACIVLAENISGSEEAFAAEMTARAQELGLSSAHFKNVTGLYDEDHKISALDLAKLASMTISNFPEYYEFYSLREFEWNGIKQPNRNPLLSAFDGADGLKTGHLEISGYGVTGSAVMDDERRIIVINGAKSIADRSQISERVMRAAFREFDVSKPVKAGDELAKAPVWLGESKTVGLALAEDLVFGYEISQRSKLNSKIVLDGSVTAPVVAGQPLGKLIITGPDDFQIERPVVAMEAVGKAGIFERALEGVATLINPPKSD